MNPKDLIAGAAQTARTSDTLGEIFAQQLAEVLRGTERRLTLLIRDLTDGSRSAIVKAGQANKARVEIRQALRDAGYDTLAESAYGTRLDRVVEEVLTTRRLATQSAEITASAETKLEALKALHATDLLDEGDEVARELWQATVRGVFGAREAGGILSDLGEIVSATEPQIQTLYDTSVSIFARQVEAVQAGNDPETLFAYMGPVDSKTREFCLARVGKVFSRKAIDAMDNGQLDNVFLTGGGYNCRHQWIEIAKSSELAPLAESGHRVPEVADQVAALRRRAA
jgi:hypothetical protein